MSFFEKMESLKQRIKMTHKQHQSTFDPKRLQDQVNARQPPNPDWLKAKMAFVQAAQIAAPVGQVIDLDQYQI